MSGNNWTNETLIGIKNNSALVNTCANLNYLEQDGTDEWMNRIYLVMNHQIVSLTIG